MFIICRKDINFLNMEWLKWKVEFNVYVYNESLVFFVYLYVYYYIVNCIFYDLEYVYILIKECK